MGTAVRIYFVSCRSAVFVALFTASLVDRDCRGLPREGELLGTPFGTKMILILGVRRLVN